MTANQRKGKKDSGFDNKTTVPFRPLATHGLLEQWGHAGQSGILENWIRLAISSPVVWIVALMNEVLGESHWNVPGLDHVVDRVILILSRKEVVIRVHDRLHVIKTWLDVLHHRHRCR